MARASSRRSLAMSQRGDSGKKRMSTMTIEGRPACTMVGILQAQEVSMFLYRVRNSANLGRRYAYFWQTYVVQPARILPSHQKLLYLSQLSISPLKRGYVGKLTFQPWSHGMRDGRARRCTLVLLQRLEMRRVPGRIDRL